jgi:hypothetical protein
MPSQKQNISIGTRILNEHPIDTVLFLKLFLNERENLLLSQFIILFLIKKQRNTIERFHFHFNCFQTSFH